jgi:hypothetical protein
MNKLIFVAGLMIIAGCATNPSELGPMTDEIASTGVHTLRCKYPYRREVCKKEAHRICKEYGVEDKRTTVIVGEGISYPSKIKVKEYSSAVVVFACEYRRWGSSQR